MNRLTPYDARPPPERLVSPPSKPLIQTGTRRRPRVLIVDDHDDTRAMYAWRMRAAGWLVAEAADGLEALSTAATFQPNAIVMDLCLPIVGGVDAIERLKADPQTMGIPVVACTGVSEFEPAARAAGCDVFVAKPCMPDLLCAILDDLIDRGRH
jgi:CheY-like chemotaxis protein